LRWAGYDRPESTAKGEVPEPADGVGANTGEATLFNVAAAPMVGATAAGEVTDLIRLGGGLAFFVPFGGSAVWDKNEAFDGHPKYPGAVDGTQRYYSIDGTIRTMYLSAGLAAAISDYVAVGLSGGLAFSTVDSLRARETSGTTDLSLEGRAWFDGRSIDPQLGGGIIGRPLGDDTLRIALSYQAPPGFTGSKLKGLLRMHNAGQLTGDQEGRDDVEMHQEMPDVFRFGVSYRPIVDLELRLFGDVTRWSLFTDQCIGKAGLPCEVNEDGSPVDPDNAPIVNLPRRWRDAFGLRLGASYWVKDPIELFLGVGYDSNAIPGANLDAAMMDFHDVAVSLGTRIQIIDELAGAISYTHLFYVSRDTAGESENPDFAGPSNGPDAGGRYTQAIGVINVNLMASFDPFGPSEAPAQARRASLAGSW
jgi:long-chain fatty acid transport protein